MTDEQGTTTWARDLDPAALLRDAPDAVLLVDAEGTILFANRQAETVFGYPAHLLVGSSVDTLLPRALRGRHTAHRAHYAAQPTVRPMGAGIELYAEHADGRVFPVEISLAPLTKDERNLTLASVRDVTQQREAERARRRSEELFRRTFESSPTGMALLRGDGTCTAVNPALCAITGRIESGLLGRDLSGVLPGSPITGRAEAVERRVVRPDGDVRWVELTVSALSGDETGEHLVAHFYDVTERRAHQRQLQAIALSDPLTGLPNRAFLLDRAQRELATLDRRRGRVALLLLDLDHFKTVNDTLGHLVGDELLRAVAQRLALTARGTDTVARLGGDEFAVLTSDLSGGENELAERLLAALEAEFRLSTDEGSPERVQIGASIGIAVATDGSVTATDLYRDADVALYEAKARGRGRALPYDASLRERLDRMVTEEQRLRRALGAGGVRLALQPLVDLQRGGVRGHEALARLAVPGTSKLVTPHDFLPVAEERGLLPSLDAAVLSLSLDRLRTSGGSLHVNVSAQSLEDGRWHADLVAAVDNEPSIAGRLCVELTEQTLIQTDGRTLRAVEALRRRGIRVGLDDFGTGYSSLSYLERLPLDFLKLDTSLTARIGGGRAARILAESIVTLGSRLGLRVVAEGIEQPVQADLLRSWGCDVGQGYLYGRPSETAALSAAEGPCA